MHAATCRQLLCSQLDLILKFFHMHGCPLIFYYQCCFQRRHLPQVRHALVLTQHNPVTQDKVHRHLQSAQLVQRQGGKDHLQNPALAAVGHDQCLRNWEKNCKYMYMVPYINVLYSLASYLVVASPLSVYVRVLGWRSGESARFSPMWPEFNSRTWHHMWIEFVDGFSSGSPVFLPPKTNTPNSNSIRAVDHHFMFKCVFQVLSIFMFVDGILSY